MTTTIWLKMGSKGLHQKNSRKFAYPNSDWISASRVILSIKIVSWTKKYPYDHVFVYFPESWKLSSFLRFQVYVLDWPLKFEFLARYQLSPKHHRNMILRLFWLPLTILMFKRSQSVYKWLKLKKWVMTQKSSDFENDHFSILTSPYLWVCFASDANFS